MAHRAGLKKVTRNVRRKGKMVRQAMWVKATSKPAAPTEVARAVPLWAKKAAVVVGTTAVGALLGRSAGGRVGASVGRRAGSVAGGPLGAVGGALAMAAITGGSAAFMTAKNARGTGASGRQVGAAMFHNAMRVGGASASAGAKAGVPVGYHAATGVGEYVGRRAGHTAGTAAGGAVGFGAGMALSRLVR